MADIEKDLKRKKKVLPVKGKERVEGVDETVVEEVLAEDAGVVAPVEAAEVAPGIAPEISPDSPPGSSREQRDNRRGGQGRRPTRRREAEASEFIEKVLAIKRVTKVTKGGKKLAFSALVVVGNEHGRVGFSLGKAGEVAAAIKKALGKAKKKMINIPLVGTTIPHEILGRCGAALVLLKPAGDGTGVIASGAIRAICDGAGIRNILTKCHRSNNPVNVVKATFDGLTRLKLVANQPADEASPEGREVPTGKDRPPEGDRQPEATTA